MTANARQRFVRILLNPHWVYILPLLHLIGCIATAVTGFEWLPVAVSELPLGVLLVAIAWRFGHPLFWFGIFGTLWWYWLARMAFNWLLRAA
jgi:hypothetical protein